jgi:hypothetical protein
MITRAVESRIGLERASSRVAGFPSRLWCYNRRKAKIASRTVLVYGSSISTQLVRNEIHRVTRPCIGYITFELAIRLFIDSSARVESSP